MHNVLPYLGDTDFPAIRRERLDTVQVNLGYLCNQSCLHCHVNAGPRRSESMSTDTAELVIRYLKTSGAGCLDITGGAPELNECFRSLVRHAALDGVRVMDRCNLTVLHERGQEDLGEFLAENKVEIVASLPCYLEENVDKQRGAGVFAKSIRAIRALNTLGYGRAGSELELNLVYNPQGAVLPPAQTDLEEDYRREFRQNYGIEFTRLLALTNLPIGRFGSTLLSKGTFADYLKTLRTAHSDDNLAKVMCKSLVSIDWRGYVYDCDFNQMLDLPLRLNGEPKVRLSSILDLALDGLPITVRNHCYGCTAGQGSSCGGVLA